MSSDQDGSFVSSRSRSLPTSGPGGRRETRSSQPEGNRVSSSHGQRYLKVYLSCIVSHTVYVYLCRKTLNRVTLQVYQVDFCTV